MKLAVIIGTTREGRETPKQALWAVKQANKIDGVEAKAVDLKDYPMPFFNEPISPRYNPNREIDPLAKKWLYELERYDAYIFITAEYNHSIPGVLKNALDYVTWEMLRKPVAVISHGANGGARASTDLKEILSESRAAVIPSPSVLAMSKMSELIDSDGNLKEALQEDPYGPQSALVNLVKDLKWYSDALVAAKDREKTASEKAPSSVKKDFAMI